MTPLDIFQRLEEIIGIDGSPRRLGTVIETELRDYFGVPPVQAAEKAEQMEGKVRQLISQSNSNSDSTGSYVVLSMSSINDRVVQGSCYIEPDEPVTTTVLKRRRLHIDPLLDHIQNLTFHQFETFGACVLKELGSKNPQVTPHSDDQGIDFYGLLSLGQLS
ncbi:MAG: hypothetical protein HZB51_05730 [Chloroflexi bacterium]|nr:hypothetical protein [Chloroflexota bacterium]